MIEGLTCIKPADWPDCTQKCMKYWAMNCPVMQNKDCPCIWEVSNE